MINQILIPAGRASSLGLRPPNEPLRGLSQLVVLAGPNGAGKTRYLKLLEQEVERYLTAVKGRATLRWVFPRLDEVLELETKEQLEDWWRVPENKASADSSHVEKATTTLWRQKQEFNHLRFTQDPSQVVWLRYSLSSPGHPDQMSPGVVDRVVEANKKGGIQTASESMHAYFDEVARALYNADHPSLKGTPEVEAQRQDALAFNRLLKSLLGIEIQPGLSSTSRVFAEVRGRRFDPGELSDGEMVLITWAILLHRQHQWLEGSILLIDEPENHLHPDVCIRAIESLRRDVLGEHGQIFLATHSVPLLAHCGLDSIYFVDEGRIEYAGRKLDALIDRLLGGKQGRERLYTFIGETEQRLFYSFAAQCLLPPGVAEAREGDPQQKQFLRLMKSRKAAGRSLRVLDHGAGKGRLALELAEAFRQSGSTERPIEYFVFNDQHYCAPEDERACRAALSRLHPGTETSHYFERFEAIQVGPSQKMDVVLMCNVLHEIPIQEWRRLFHKLADILSEDGLLLLMEDSHPPIGELPNPTGFLLLDGLSAQALFHSNDGVRVIDRDKGGRLIALEIDQRVLRNVSKDSLERALGKIRDCALEEIKHLRGSGDERSAYDRGRLHAHYTMLYTNACLALEA
ncbi:AAA family ATPase [Archangium lipolyticum]|uniref:AAA family ATPase n=1 Tax=Archangium lipolyticum TaxID=2970465 RepID=UPI00214A8053|nr:AAA family ATPase [Archangium lipolyticum]